jgi:hypothetical protein
MVTATESIENKINSTSQSLPWIIYLIFVLLSSFIGDSIILISSMRYNVIKLNKLIVVVMQHIALCDILAATFFVLPTLISILAKEWILGDVVAYIHLFFNTCTFIANNILICSLVSIKLIILKFPLRTRNWNKKHIHMTCALVWVMAAIITGLRTIFDKGGLLFSFIDYNINYGLPSQYFVGEKVLLYVNTVVGVYVPTFIIISTSLGIAVYLVKSRRAAKQSGGDMRWQGMVTVVSTTTVYCLATIPYASFVIISTLSSKSVSGETRVNVRRFFESLSTLNIMCNFFIYILTVPSLRIFLTSKASQISMRLTKSPELFRGNQQEDCRDQQQMYQGISSQQDSEV